MLAELNPLVQRLRKAVVAIGDIFRGPPGSRGLTRFESRPAHRCELVPLKSMASACSRSNAAECRIWDHRRSPWAEPVVRDHLGGRRGLRDSQRQKKQRRKRCRAGFMCSRLRVCQWSSRCAFRARIPTPAWHQTVDFVGRGSWIRTNDLQYPKLPRYQAALYPDGLSERCRYTLQTGPARRGTGPDRGPIETPGA